MIYMYYDKQGDIDLLLMQNKTYKTFPLKLTCIFVFICFFFQCDKFTIEAVDLGKPFKVRIRHDNSGFNAAWFLDRVEVIDDDGETHQFHCERWLSKKKDDGKLERSLYVKVRGQSSIIFFGLSLVHFRNHDIINHIISFIVSAH